MTENMTPAEAADLVERGTVPGADRAIRVLIDHARAAAQPDQGQPESHVPDSDPCPTCGTFWFAGQAGLDTTGIYAQPDQGRLYEQLAAIQHDIWSHWMKYLVGTKATANDDGSAILAAEDVEHWRRQRFTPYHMLTEAEKASDREQVDRFWHLVAPSAATSAATAQSDQGQPEGHDPHLIEWLLAMTPGTCEVHDFAVFNEGGAPPPCPWCQPAAPAAAVQPEPPSWPWNPEPFVEAVDALQAKIIEHCGDSESYVGTQGPEAIEEVRRELVALAETVRDLIPEPFVTWIPAARSAAPTAPPVGLIRVEGDVVEEYAGECNCGRPPAPLPEHEPHCGWELVGYLAAAAPPAAPAAAVDRGALVSAFYSYLMAGSRHTAAVQAVMREANDLAGVAIAAIIEADGGLK